jgi:hypothetical protein
VTGDGDIDIDHAGVEFDLATIFGEITPEAEELAQRMTEAMRTPLAPGDPRRHHFIPRFFLRGFARDEQIMSVRLDQPAKRRRVSTAGMAGSAFDEHRGAQRD